MAYVTIHQLLATTEWDSDDELVLHRESGPTTYRLTVGSLRELLASDLASSFAPASHNHDSAYAALSHNHDGAYAALSHNHAGVYAPLANGVTNGDSHDHSGGDGAQIAHSSLSGAGTNTHAQIDAYISSKGAANGLATLNGSSLVVENPANATATPTASKIPIADGGGKLDGWVSAASETVAGKIEVATSAEIDASTDTGRALAPDQFAASRYGIRYVQIQLTGTDALTTGDTKAVFRVPPALDGMNLVYAAAYRRSGSGTMTIQIKNYTDNTTMLSSAMSGSTNGVWLTGTVNSSYDDVASGDDLEINVSAAGTSSLHVSVVLGFRMP